MTTDTAADAAAEQGRTAPASPDERRPILEVDHLGIRFEQITALEDVTVDLYPGEVTCVLGHNGAGKSVFIKALCGVHQPSSGQVKLDGDPVSLDSPRRARALGIFAVHQDLALVPLLSLWRNFFLGAEPVHGWGIFRQFDAGYARATLAAEMDKLGMEVGDPDRAARTLSGGERQAVAIARALYHGARVLVLDEPTTALGAQQAGTVLRLIRRTAERGTAVVLVSPRLEHTYPIGDRFLVFRRGHLAADLRKDQVTQDQLSEMLAGGTEREQIEAALLAEDDHEDQPDDA